LPSPVDAVVPPGPGHIPVPDPSHEDETSPNDSTLVLDGDSAVTSWRPTHSSPSPVEVHAQGTSSQSANGDIEHHITSADLLNPSDALSLLARVADRDNVQREDMLVEPIHPQSTSPLGDDHQITNLDTGFSPLVNGDISYSGISQLVNQYAPHTSLFLTLLCKDPPF
jgi:hypothetical protein